jgi:hypothetical protein
MVTNLLKALFSKIPVVDFSTFFSFTEADARVLLSAYGFGPVEIDDGESDRPDQAKHLSRRQLSKLPRTDQALGPISIGVHPHIIWRTGRSLPLEHAVRRRTTRVRKQLR